MPDTPDAAAISQTVADFVSEHTRHQVTDHAEDIFAVGHVNSLFAMQLVLFVETTFGIALGADDLDFDNFRSIAAIADLVVRKKAPQQIA